MLPPVADILKLICWAVIGLFRSRASLEAEILALRQQLNVLRRTSPKRPAFSYVRSSDFRRPLSDCATRSERLMIIEPETFAVGIAPVSACSGDGSRGAAAADRMSRWKSAN